MCGPSRSDLRARGRGAPRGGARGTLLGVWPDVAFETARLVLEPGGGLVVFTDGVTEQGAHVASAAPETMLAGSGAAPGAEGLADVLERYADRVASPQRDDIAILALRFGGEAGASGKIPQFASFARL